MPLVYAVSEAKEQIHVLGRGEVSTSDCVAMIEALSADPLFAPHLNVLADIRELTYAPGEDSELLKIADSISESPPPFKGSIAIVAKGALLFSAVLIATRVRARTPINIKVFPDPTAAQAFLINNQLSSLPPAKRSRCHA